MPLITHTVKLCSNFMFQLFKVRTDVSKIYTDWRGETFRYAILVAYFVRTVVQSCWFSEATVLGYKIITSTLSGYSGHTGCWSSGMKKLI